MITLILILQILTIATLGITAYIVAKFIKGISGTVSVVQDSVVKLVPIIDKTTGIVATIQEFVKSLTNIFNGLNIGK